MNTSTLVLTPASERLICDVVDSNCALNLSEQPQIVIFAYCAVFLPWAVLALFDMINERWKTMRRVFIQGLLQILIAIPTMGYTFYYIELQRADRDYKEMCAAIVAVFLSAFHFSRTAWGLWQTYWYWRWVRFCLERLNRYGYSLEDIERSCLPNDEYWRRRLWSYERRLKSFSLLMKINNRVVDNEFVECDVPFQINYSKLCNPHMWFSSKGLFTPQNSTDSSLRYMIPFLAQFGRNWIRDCDQAKAVLGETKIYYEIAFITRNAVKYAKMLTEQNSKIFDREPTVTNWSSMWFYILKCQEKKGTHFFPSGLPMPFRENEHFCPLEEMYARYESRIKRLIDSLPQELFELDSRESDKGEVVQRISAFHLECFLIFLGSEVGNEQIDFTGAPGAGELEAGTVGSPDTLSHPESSFPHLEASATNSATVLTERNEAEEQICETDAEAEASGSESKTHPIGNGDERHSRFHRRAPIRRTRTDRYFRWWSFERVTNEKMQTYKYDYEGLKEFSVKRIVEFTIHLDNIFSLSSCHRGYIQDRLSPASGAEREAYYAELCGAHRTIRKVGASEKVIPRCESQRQFWRLWNLPECLPFALGDVNLATDGRRGGVKFIGYVMEIVRDCLAKWVSRHACRKLDASVWSPEIRTDSAYVEMKTINEFVNMGLNYAELIAPGSFKERALAREILWEVQNHIRGLIDNDECDYGPSSVELMLLCMLGLPCLHLSQIDPGKEFRVEFDKVYQKPFAIYVYFNRDAASYGKIRFSITPLVGGSSFRFEWANWIHAFESGMKVLTYKYEENDLLQMSAIPIKINVDDAAKPGREDGEVDQSIKGKAVGRESVIMDSVAVAELDTNGVSPEGRDEDGAAVSAGCSCGCKYKLNSKAKRVFIKESNGAEMFFWEWEGWRPQQTFEEGRYPILHDVQKPEKKNGQGKGGEEQGMGTNGRSPTCGGSEVRADEKAFGDEDEQLYRSTLPPYVP